MERGIAGDGDRQAAWIVGLAQGPGLLETPGDWIASWGLGWCQQGPELPKIQMLLGKLRPLACPFLQVL
jgi:hypothetical protein